MKQNCTFVPKQKRKKATAVLLCEGCDDTTQLSGPSLVGGNTFLDTGS